MNYSTLKTTHNNDKTITIKNINNLIAYAQKHEKYAKHWTEQDYWTTRIKLLNRIHQRIKIEEIKIAENLKYKNPYNNIED